MSIHLHEISESDCSIRQDRDWSVKIRVRRLPAWPRSVSSKGLSTTNTGVLRSGAIDWRRSQQMVRDRRFAVRR